MLLTELLHPRDTRGIGKRWSRQQNPACRWTLPSEHGGRAPSSHRISQSHTRSAGRLGCA